LLWRGAKLRRPEPGGDRSADKRRYMAMWRVLSAAVVSLVMGVAPPAWAEGDDEEIPFDVAEIFFELNDTDGDLGIHALVDGEPWKRLEMEDPNERRMLKIRVRGRLRRQGLTELFFESAEPTFDELSPEEFFDRFPEGTYEVEGVTLDGEELESETEVTHVMPAPPVFTVNGIPALPPEGEECDEDNLPQVTNPVVIEWDAVTESHPELGAEDPEIEIIRYEAVAEWENEDELTFVSNVQISPDDLDSYSVTVSPEFFEDGMEVKFEVLAREASFNQTAVESCPFEFVD
jgi:hypothetical protein